jgi:spore coat protein A
VFRPSDGMWYILKSSDGGNSFSHFGINGDVPVPGDYDGDGKADLAVYRDGTWYINGSTTGFSAQVFGSSTDKPVPAAYRP